MNMKPNNVRTSLSLYLYELRPWNKDALKYLKSIKVATKTGEETTVQLKQRQMIRPNFVEPEFGRQFNDLMSMAKKFRWLIKFANHVKQRSELDQAIHDELVGQVFPLTRVIKGLSENNLREFS
jgi:hypothetical protein